MCLSPSVVSVKENAKVIDYHADLSHGNKSRVQPRIAHQNESRKDQAPPGLSFSAKYTREENVSTATPTSNISRPSSLYAWKEAKKQSIYMCMDDDNNDFIFSNKITP